MWICVQNVERGSLSTQATEHIPNKLHVGNYVRPYYRLWVYVSYKVLGLKRVNINGDIDSGHGAQTFCPV